MADNERTKVEHTKVEHEDEVLADGVWRVCEGVPETMRGDDDTSFESFSEWDEAVKRGKARREAASMQVNAPAPPSTPSGALGPALAWARDAAARGELTESVIAEMLADLEAELKDPGAASFETELRALLAA